MKPDWTYICQLNDIPRLRARRVARPQGLEVALFRTGQDAVYGLLDHSPYKGGPLSQGMVFGANVACPLHNWTIDLASGQAPSMRTLEEKDANGLEVVLALRAEDQGKPLDKIAAYRFFKVAQVPAHPFYGEVRQDGSIYVFKRYGDMQDMVKLGEPIFRYTDIGSGPNGQTVTYGLQKEEGRPDATIAQFKKNHML